MKRYSIVLALVIPLLVMVLIKSFTTGHFRSDASKWAESSINQTNLIMQEQLKSLEEKPLMVILDEGKAIPDEVGETVNIPARTLLEKDNQKKLRAHTGSIVLVSADPAISAKIWMLLSQMGYKKLYILTDSTDNEVLKYKFRPDTGTVPEL